MLTGTIYKINDNTVDIKYNDEIIPEVPIDFVKGKLEFDKEIEFYNYENIYADLDISRNGKVDVFINTFRFGKCELTDNMASIVYKIKTFINKLYQIDSLQLYRRFINPISLASLNKNVEFSKSNLKNLIYQYTIQPPKRHNCVI